ncbi:MAG: response regulator transcription factor [Clostridia bacterium]|nr:response regulator transcription factor [Clostridia bacterium]
MFKILFADDEAKIRETVNDYFTTKGVEVHLAENGGRAVELVEENEYDLIILDVMMPVLNGLEACRRISKITKAPVLFLSALGEERDFLAGLSSGADDYIVKPFPLSVLFEKSQRMIRRYRGLTDENLIISGEITLDKNRFKVFAGGKEITLSSKDFQLLEYLMSNKNIVLSRQIILSRVWGYDFEGDDRVVDTHIKIIRKALGEKACAIKTVVNVGYKFEEV